METKIVKATGKSCKSTYELRLTLNNGEEISFNFVADHFVDCNENDNWIDVTDIIGYRLGRKITDEEKDLISVMGAWINEHSINE